MTSANVEIVRTVYNAIARGNMVDVLSAMGPKIVWTEAENFPYADGSPYFGPTAVADGVFARLSADWDRFAPAIEELLDAGDAVIALGRYKGAYKATGKSVNAQFAHVWRAEGGKLVGFQQFLDTLQIAHAMQR